MIPVGLTGLTVKQWVQLGVAVALLAVLAWAGIAVLHWKHQAGRVPGLEQEIKDYAASLARYKQDLVATQAASQGFQDELARLRTAAAAQPARPVRVCRDAPTGQVPGPAPKPGPDEGASPGGVFPQTPGPDIGPELYGDAELADTLSAQIRGLKAYITGVCHAEEAGT